MFLRQEIHKWEWALKCWRGTSSPIITPNVLHHCRLYIQYSMRMTSHAINSTDYQVPKLSLSVNLERTLDLVESTIDLVTKFACCRRCFMSTDEHVVKYSCCRRRLMSTNEHVAKYSCCQRCLVSTNEHVTKFSCCRSRLVSTDEHVAMYSCCRSSLVSTDAHVAKFSCYRRRLKWIHLKPVKLNTRANLVMSDNLWWKVTPH